MILRINRESPGRNISVRGLLFSDRIEENRRFEMVLKEKVMSKITIYQIKDWDTFQMVMRGIL